MTYDAADVLDVLAVVPLLLAENAEKENRYGLPAEYERRRRRNLDELKIDWSRIRREEAI